MNDIRIGIIGCGFMGRTSAQTITRYLEGAKLIAVAGGARAAKLAEDYAVTAEATVGRLLARKDVDAVFISTPHADHAQQAIEAAEQGKHILLDKPMATTVEDCDRILEATGRNKVNLMIMFGQRFRIANMEARRVIREGAIGRVTMVQEFILNGGGLKSLPPWQSKPENLGSFFAHGVHNIDRIRWLTGEEITSVAGQVQHDPVSGNEVSTMAVLGMSGGVMASIWGSWTVPAPGFPRTASSAWIVGETGVLDLDAYGQIRLGKDGAWTVVAEQSPIDWKGKGMLDPVRIEAYQKQGKEFLDSIREGRAPSVTGKDGRAAVEVALATYQSAAGKRTIHLGQA